jgi:hypothetical protein
MEPEGDVIRCLVFLERGFRMLVDMVPPRGHVIVEFGDTVDDRHGACLRMFGSTSIMRDL